MTTGPRSPLHLVLSLHEPQFYRRRGRTWLERLLIRVGFLPPFPDEDEVGSVWVVLPGRSADDYETEGTDVTGPLPGAKARHEQDRLRATFEAAGFTVVVETDYP